MQSVDEEPTAHGHEERLNAERVRWGFMSFAAAGEDRESFEAGGCLLRRQQSLRENACLQGWQS